MDDDILPNDIINEDNIDDDAENIVNIQEDIQENPMNNDEIIEIMENDNDNQEIIDINDDPFDDYVANQEEDPDVELMNPDEQINLI